MEGTTCNNATPAPATGMVRVLLQLEGFFIMLACILGYAKTGGNWFIFGLGFFASDLFSLGYLGGNRLGAVMYNTSHALVGPLVTFIVYIFLSETIILQMALIWASHIGWERSLGYGLRYPNGFVSTHITVDQDPMECLERHRKKNSEAVEPLNGNDEAEVRNDSSYNTFLNRSLLG
jgi:hypothetical protein